MAEQTIRPTGRPSAGSRARVRAQARTQLVGWLTESCRHLARPSLLSESPLCEIEAVTRRAALSPHKFYPRARVVIEAVRDAHAAAAGELAATGDALPLAALADALAGMSRAESARRAGVSTTEISRRRQEAIEIIADHVLDLLQGD